MEGQSKLLSGDDLLLLSDSLLNGKMEQSTNDWINAWKEWSQRHGKFINLEIYTHKDVNLVLCEFCAIYISLKYTVQS